MPTTSSNQVKTTAAGRTGVQPVSGSGPTYGTTKVQYVLEVWRQTNNTRKFLSSFFLPHVQAIQLEIPETGRVTFTLGDTPIIERAGRRARMISVSGRSGVKYRTAQDRNGAIFFASGTDIFKEFEAFLRKYQKDAKNAQDNSVNVSSGSPEERYYMVFRGLWENWSYRVEPQTVMISRDTQTTRNSYAYSLQMMGYQEVEAPKRDIFGKAEDLAKSASRFINQASAYVDFANNYVTEALSTGRAFFEPVKAVGRVFGRLSNLSRTTSAIFDLPRETAFHILDVCDDALSTVDLVQIVATNAEVQKAKRDARVAIELAKRNVMIGIGGTKRTYKSTNIESKPFALRSTTKQEFSTLEGTIVTPYVVKAGDTLSTIAYEELGDADFSQLIANINNMTNETVLSNGQPLTPGAVILLPVNEPAGSFQIPSVEQAFGTDFLLKDDDLVIRGSQDDFVMTSGGRLIEQALSVRIQTRRGESIFPDFGLLDLIGTKTVLETLGIISSDVTSQISSDPRISSLDRVEVFDGGDTYEVSCRAFAIGGRQLNLINIPTANVS